MAPKIVKFLRRTKSAKADFTSANSVEHSDVEPDETKKGELMKAYLTQSIPNALKMFEKFLKANGGKFFVGNAVSDFDLLF